MSHTLSQSTRSTEQHSLTHWLLRPLLAGGEARCLPVVVVAARSIVHSLDHLTVLPNTSPWPCLNCQELALEVDETELKRDHVKSREIERGRYSTAHMHFLSCGYVYTAWGRLGPIKWRHTASCSALHFAAITAICLIIWQLCNCHVPIILLRCSGHTLPPL